MNWPVFWGVFARWLIWCVVAVFLSVIVAVVGELTDGVSTLLLIVALALAILHDEYREASK